MGRIEQKVTRKSSPPSSVADVILRLTSCPDEELEAAWRDLSNWSLPRSDLHHWIPVLNRFDAILEKSVTQHDIKVVQRVSFESSAKIVLLAVLKITKLLWDNCASRAIYNSTEHMTSLLHTSDMEVLEATLRFLVTASQRIQKLKGIKALLAPAVELSILLAQPFGTNESSMDLVYLAEHLDSAGQNGAGHLRTVDSPEEWSAFFFQFYRSRESAQSKLEEATIKEKDDRTTPPSNTLSESLTPLKSSKHQTAPVDVQATAGSIRSEGLYVIHIPNVRALWNNVDEAFAAVISEHCVPDGIHQFAIFHKLRIAFGIVNDQSRNFLIRIRLWSLSLAALLATDEQLRSKIFLYEPDLIQKLVRLLDINSPSSLDLQIAAVSTLECLGKHRAQFAEGLTALNVSANHGALMTMVKRIVTCLDSDEPIFSQDFFDALYSLLNHIMTSQSGISMLMSAGFVQAITPVIAVSRELHYKNIAKLVNLLDSIIQNTADSFSIFASARGLDLIISRLKDEVSICISLGKISAVDNGKDLPLDRISYLRSLLKFLMHMMQTSGSLEGLRNLIDSSLPETVRLTFENAKLFGASIFGLAVNIMASFVHNEPTSLTILQDAKLQAAFYKVAASAELPISPEVITALPNAFGALCLNQAGLDAFQAAKPIENFLKTLTSEEHIGSFQDNEIPNLVGRSIDELIRHHPSLKEEVLASVMKMVEAVLEIGHMLHVDELHLRTLHVHVEGDSRRQFEGPRKEARISHFIDVVARFLDGLFQCVSHCKDFISMGGIPLLLKFYELPSIPFDFPMTEKSYALSYILRVSVEANSRAVLPAILAGILNSIEKVDSFLKHEGDSYVLKYIAADGISLTPRNANKNPESDSVLVTEGQETLRSLTIMHIYLRLLSDMYCTNMMTHAKSIGAIVQTFSGKLGDKIIPYLGQVYRACVIENLLLKASVPSAWYEDPPKKPRVPPLVDDLSRSTSANGLDVLDIGGVSLSDVPTSGSGDKGVDDQNGVSQNDFRAKNTALFKQLFVEIPNFLIPSLQGILRQLYTRRLILDKIVCAKITHSIGVICVEHLQWSRLKRLPLHLRASFYRTIIGSITSLTLDGNSQTSLQTAFADAFVKAGGLISLLEYCEVLLDQVLDSVSSEVSKENAGGPIVDQLEMIFSLFATYTSGKLLASSPTTTILQAREKDRGHALYWESSEFLIDIRAKILPLVFKIWTGDYLKHCSTSFIKLVLSTMIQILKSDGEVALQPSSLGAQSLASMLSRTVVPVTPVIPDQEKVGQLVDMGFPSRAAEVALTRCNNNLARAAEFLLTHPEVVSASYAAPPALSPTAPPPAPSSAPPGALNTSDSQSLHRDVIDSSSATEHSAMQTSITTEPMAEDSALDEGLLQPVTEMLPSGTVDLDKGKGKEEARSALTEKIKLDRLRDDLLEGLMQRSLELMPYFANVLFSVKEMLAIVAKSSIDKVFEPLAGSLNDSILVRSQASGGNTGFAPITSIFAADADLTIGLRFFALWSTDPVNSFDAVSKCSQFLGNLITFFCNEWPSRTDKAVVPVWLTPCLLVIDSVLVIADEPLKYKLNTFDENGGSTSADNPARPIDVTIDSRLRILRSCVDILREPNIDSGLYEAALRVVMNLTRNYSVSVEFVKLGGVAALFSRLGTFRSQHMITVVVLRHLFESPQVVKTAFFREIAERFASTARNRTLDVLSFVKGSTVLACRDAAAFVDATTESCRISGYEPSQKQQMIELRQEFLDNPNSDLSSETRMDEEPLFDASQVISYLVNEILAIKTLPIHCDGIMELANLHVRRGFLLTSLAELVQCYPSSKFDLIKATQKKQLKGTPHKGSKSSFLSHLLTELLPIDAEVALKANLNIESEMRLAQSTWAAAVVIGLCAGPNTGSEDPKTKNDFESKSLTPDYSQIRRSVIDSISVAMKDAVSSAESNTIRYARFFALADLIFKLLSTTKARPGADENAAYLPRIMLDKNIVLALTSMLSEVDIFHPHASQLTASILRPLESLSKIATRLGRSNEHSSTKSAPVAQSDASEPQPQHWATEEASPMEDLQQMAIVDVELPYTSVENDAIAQQNSEISDIYRNSALGMFNARESEGEDADDDDGENDDDDEDDDDDNDDDDDGDDDEGIGFHEAGYSDDEDGDQSDAEDDMEIVVPHPYHGAHEHDESTDDDNESSNAPENLNDAEDGNSNDADEMVWDEGGANGNADADDPLNHEDDEEANLDEDDDEGQESEGSGDEGDLESGDDDGQVDIEADIVFDGVLDDRNGAGLHRFHPSQLIRRHRGGGVSRRQLSEIELGPNAFDAIMNSSRAGRGGFNDLFEAVFRTTGHPAARATDGESLLHPLLVNQPASSVTGRHGHRSDIARTAASYQPESRGELRELTALDDLIGGILETGRRPNQIIGGIRMHAFHPSALGVGVAPIQPTELDGTQGTDLVATSGDQRIRNDLQAIHQILPMTLVERWGLESKMLFGVRETEIATRTVNPILNVLIPFGIEDKRIRDQEEKKRLAAKAIEAERLEKEKLLAEEEEARRKAEEARLAAALQPPATDVGMSEASSALSTIDESVNVPVQPMDTAIESSIAPARVVVIVNGNEIDITDSGIDPDFLAALPEDLQQEVLRDHIREQRQRNAPPAAATVQAGSSSDMSEFLNALPDDVRNEVMRQQGRATASAAGGAGGIVGPLDIDPASFLATLDPDLRDAVLIDQDQDFILSLPPTFMAQASEALRRFAGPRHGLGRPFSGTQLNPAAANAGTVSAPLTRRVGREAIQLVEKPALMTLLRLLYVHDQSNKSLLHRLLLNISENSKTRSELVYLLLSILSDGSADIVAVGKSFAQLSLKAKSKQAATTPKKLSQPPSSTSVLDNAPNLIPQRSIEALMTLVSHNRLVVEFLLSENEKFGLSISRARSASKKVKGKDRAAIQSYPVVILLGLLDRPSYLGNQLLLEQLVQLISLILKGIPKERALGEPSKVVSPADKNDVGQPSSLGTDTTNGKPGASATDEKSPLISARLPSLPEHNLRAIINVLKAGDCSSKTFQSTLSMLQHLGGFAPYKDILQSELTSSAKELGIQVNNDVLTLLQSLSEGENHGVALTTGSGILVKIAVSSSAQAKLLRTLKALDFMLSKSGGAAVEDINPQDIESLGKSLLESYDNLDFAYLWQNLGELLKAIAGSTKIDMVNIATVVLPLIESFMVVAKPYVKASGIRSTVPALISQRSRGDLKDMQKDELFYVFTEEHRKILNAMLRNNPSLMSGSFSLLVLNSKILEFDNKRTFFLQQLTKRTDRENYGTLQINVRREFVFEDSYHQLHGRRGEDIKFSKLNVRFHNEEGVDAGGVAREWFSALARQMFNPDYALFKPSAVDKVTYQPNRSSWINPEHLSYFKFVGRVIGKAIYDGRLLDCYFTRSFYKAMLEIPVDWKDIEAIDPEFHKSLEWMLNNDITDIIDLTFSTEIEEFGRNKIVDLKPSGRNIVVTEENKSEYVRLITEQKLVIAIKQQIDAFLEGFFEVIPKDLIKIFNEQELELLISGLPDIDIDDWKNNTEYVTYTASSTIVQWFWRAVRSFSQEERAKMIQFVTGTSKVPLEGFKALEGSSGVQKFQIHKDFSSNTRLPSAHTCFNQIDIPEYDSYEQLRSSILTAISEGGTGFGFA